MLWSAKFGHKLRGCPQTLPLPWQVLAQLASKTSPMPEFDKDSALYFDGPFVEFSGSLFGKLLHCQIAILSFPQ